MRSGPSFFPLVVTVTARSLWTNSPVSGSKAVAVAVTSALPPVNSAEDRPWNSAGTVCTVTLQGVVPVQGTNTEKKPLMGTPPRVCFNCPEMVTKVCCEQTTKPDRVAAPVVGSTDPKSDRSGYASPVERGFHRRMKKGWATMVTVWRYLASKRAFGSRLPDRARSK